MLDSSGQSGAFTGRNEWTRAHPVVGCLEGPMAKEPRARCQLCTLSVHRNRFGGPKAPAHVYAAFTIRERQRRWRLTAWRPWIDAAASGDDRNPPPHRSACRSRSRPGCVSLLPLSRSDLVEHLPLLLRRRLTPSTGAAVVHRSDPLRGFQQPPRKAGAPPQAQAETRTVLRSLDTWKPHPMSTDTPVPSGCIHAQNVIGCTPGRRCVSFSN